MRKSPAVLILSLFTFCFFIVVGVAIMSFMGDRSSPGGAPGGAITFTTVKKVKVGVIEINGVIMESKKTVERIEAMASDKRIKGIIVRVNSPGGAVAPAQEIYDALKKAAAHKPVHASMGSLAASGGYYVACGAQKIWADAGTLTGSIGVIMQFMDASKLYQWAKLSPYNVKTGKFKDIGSPDREMTPDEKALLQELIDNVLSQFRRAVMEARKLSIEKVVEVSDGRIFSGEQAKALKLVDELGGLRDVADAMAKEIEPGLKVQMVYPRKQHRMLIERLFEDSDEDDDGLVDEGHSAVNWLVRAVALTLGFKIPVAESAPMGVDSMQPGLMFLMPLGR